MHCSLTAKKIVSTILKMTCYDHERPAAKMQAMTMHTRIAKRFHRLDLLFKRKPVPAPRIGTLNKRSPAKASK